MQRIYKRGKAGVRNRPASKKRLHRAPIISNRSGRRGTEGGTAIAAWLADFPLTNSARATSLDIENDSQFYRAGSHHPWPRQQLSSHTSCIRREFSFARAWK